MLSETNIRKIQKRLEFDYNILVESEIINKAIVLREDEDCLILALFIEGEIFNICIQTENGDCELKITKVIFE